MEAKINKYTIEIYLQQCSSTKDNPELEQSVRYYLQPNMTYSEITRFYHLYSLKCDL